MAHWDDSTDELVVRARGGDGDAWARLVDRHSRLLWSIARSHGLNDADSGDVVQTTWLRLVERIDTLRDPGATPCWLATTARNESLRLVRRRARDLPLVPAPRAPEPSVREPSVPEPSAREPGPDRVVLDRERVGQVGAALDALPRRCRTLLRLFALAPTQAELAAALGIPVGSVGPTRARCLDALRRLVP
ncbi:RNA polymerase sigma factor [Actinomadura sp. 3N508]|uniref:RNA polymerase sigma factor n=1 Tax=Actinomadura sp. 3N508 TaxID=3375153 RepID=UPI0037AF4346